MKPLLDAQVHGHRRLARAHDGGDHGPALAAPVQSPDEGNGFPLVPPREGPKPNDCGRRVHAGCISRAKAAAWATVSSESSPITATTRWRSANTLRRLRWSASI